MAPTTPIRVLLVASLAAVSFASPCPASRIGSRVPAAARCQEYGECIDVDVFGYQVKRLVGNSTHLDPSIYRRKDDANTNVEVGEGEAQQRTSARGKDDAPSAVFGELWDRIDEACLDTTCDEAKLIEAEGLQLSVTGQFANKDAKENFFELLREAFFRTEVIKETTEFISLPGPAPGVPGGQVKQTNRDTSVTDFLNANIFGGENSGQYMTVRVTRIPDEPGCGPALDAINGLGALVPKIAPFFGIIDVICATVSK